MIRDSLLIARREIIDTVRTRAFWIGLLLFPLIWFVALSIPSLMERKAARTRAFVIGDRSGEVAAVITNALRRRALDADLKGLANWAARYAPTARAPATVDELAAAGGVAAEARRLAAGSRSNAPAYQPAPERFVVAPWPGGERPEGLTAAADALRPWFKGERPLEIGGRKTELFAAVLVESGFAAGAATNRPSLQFWSANLADTTLQDWVEEAVNSEVRQRAFRGRGIDPEMAKEIENRRAVVTALDPTKPPGEAKVGVGDRVRQFLPSAISYLLWVAIFTISQMLMNSVIEEKSSRVVEILVSSVRPEALMLGKLLGAAAVGLLMLSCWIATAVLGGRWMIHAQSGSSGGGDAAAVAGEISRSLQAAEMLPGLIGFFILGYLIYGAFFLALGSACNSPKEVQALVGLVMPVLLVPLMATPFIPRDPNGPLATALSWIPPFTPFVMMNRMGAHPPWRDLIGAPLLAVAFLAVEIWAAARIFRQALLRVGEPPRWSDFWRWLRRGG